MEAIYDQEQKQEEYMEQEPSAWVKPELRVIGVSLECTAYAGAI